jgi:hypothetical protein
MSGGPRIANYGDGPVIRLTIELTPDQAAGLRRFADKTGFEEAMAVLYPHVAHNTRAEQAHTILTAVGKIDAALEEAEVSAWPWIDTGRT